MAWQVQGIARTLNLPAPLFVRSVDHQSGVTTVDVLIEAAAWLRRQRYKLLIDNLAFPIGLEQLREAFRVTHSLSLTVRLI